MDGKGRPKVEWMRWECPSYAKSLLRAATPSTNCERTKSHPTGSVVTAGKEAGVDRSISRPSNRDPRKESTDRRGLLRDPRHN